MFSSGIQNDFRHLDDVGGHRALAHGILRYELQQRWILKIIWAFEMEALMHQLRVLIEEGVQRLGIPTIQEFDRSTKSPVLDLTVGRHNKILNELLKWVGCSRKDVKSLSYDDFR